MDLSIVIPVYNEEMIIPELFDRLSKTLSQLSLETEIIIINDGSADNTFELLKSFLTKIPCLKIINLSRNFGHQPAFMAGIANAKGNAIIMMDGDLQDPPEIIPDLIVKWKNGFHIVSGARKSRGENFLKRTAFNIFHKIFSYLSDYPMPVYSGMFSLIDRKVANELINLNERNRFIPGLRDWVGFSSSIVWYDRPDRAKGKPKQTFSKLFKLACDAIFSFSYKPLRLIFLFGIFISSLSFTYGFVLTVLRIFKINYVKGFTTTAVSIFFLSGIILLSLGIIGEYLGRIYDEVKKRPLFIISDIITKPDNK